MIDGLGAGIGCLVVSLLTNEKMPSWPLILAALLLGFISYGLSIVIYITAQNKIGVSKTSAYYSINPFIATFLSFLLIPGSTLGPTYFIGLIVMIAGTILVIIDTLKTPTNENKKSS